jgi:hypothetical protein
MQTELKNAWDSKPQYVDYHGQTIECFRLGGLAIALNRQPGTIRSMVLKGVLCHPLLKNGNGQWLFTRDQITDLIALAEAEGVLNPNYRRTFSSSFITQAHQILHRLPT